MWQEYVQSSQMSVNNKIGVCLGSNASLRNHLLVSVCPSICTIHSGAVEGTDEPGGV
jgi:hypothetical protein